MVRRLMSNIVGKEAKSQIDSIFHFRCLVLGKLFFIIIDGGSSVNMASSRLMGKLGIPTLSHPKPYIEKGKIVVDRQVSLAFTIENYFDKVMCDVMTMEATHILFGKPWKFDRKVTH
ncbi:hypothetical protein CR513_27430, partial [Mucuna pruriens]